MPRAADKVQMTTIHSTLRPAIRPARAASALRAIPTISSATTSGTTVILSRFSHSSPTRVAAWTTACCGGSPTPRIAIPASSPRTSAASTTNGLAPLIGAALVSSRSVISRRSFTTPP